FGPPYKTDAASPSRSSRLACTQGAPGLTAPVLPEQPGVMRIDWWNGRLGSISGVSQSEVQSHQGVGIRKNFVGRQVESVPKLRPLAKGKEVLGYIDFQAIAECLLNSQAVVLVRDFHC